MNKKAQLAESLIPIVAGALSAVILLSFLTYTNDLENISSDVSALMAQTKFSEEYIKQQAMLLAKESILECKGCDVDGLAATMLTKTQQRKEIYSNENTENLAAQIRSGNFLLSSQPDKTYKLEVPMEEKGPMTIQTNVSANKLTRTLRLCMLFDEQGEFLHDC